MTNNKPSYGIIVGRFQVHNLHEGHLELFRQVSALHERVIVFIGVHPTGITRRNPLDFETRKKMIQAEYPDFMFFPLPDRGNDEAWSKDLDERIGEVVQYGTATLYGGRDSFTPYYHGKYKVHELILTPSISGTEVRASLTNRVMQSPDFRAGIIYAANNMYPRCVTTVDIAIVNRGVNGEIRVLLGRKDGEPAWRFIGGHAVPYKTFEAQAKVETREESGLDLIRLTYIGSEVIDDWRWKKEVDGVVTLFFVGESMTLGGKADDDIKEICWFDIFPKEDFDPTQYKSSWRGPSIFGDQTPPIMPVHQKLWERLIAYLKKEREHAATISS
jgi:bifunctional NMN adenylyltransferase/nudix hydrolase